MTPAELIGYGVAAISGAAAALGLARLLRGKAPPTGDRLRGTKPKPTEPRP